MPVQILAIAARALVSELVATIEAEIAQAVTREVSREILTLAGVLQRASKISAKIELDFSNLDRFRSGIRQAVVRAATTAAKPVLAAGIANAQRIRASGDLAAAMGMTTELSSEGIATIIGPRDGFAHGKHRPSVYAWLVEKGTRRSRPRPFMEPAQASTAGAYRDRLTSGIAAELEAINGPEQ